MAIPELVRRLVDRKVSAFLDRVPSHARAQLRYTYEVRGNHVTLVEERPHFGDPSAAWTRHPFAQVRYDPKAGAWALYCADRNGKWHRYRRLELEADLDLVLAEIDRDPTHIFFG